MINKLVISIMLIINLYASAFANETGSANQLLSNCRDGASQTVTAIDADPFMRGICLGMMVGARSSTDNGSLYCVPRNATNAQMLRVAVQYIDARPHMLHESFIFLAMMSFIEAWPCANNQQ